MTAKFKVYDRLQYTRKNGDLVEGIVTKVYDWETADQPPWPKPQHCRYLYRMAMSYGVRTVCECRLSAVDGVLVEIVEGSLVGSGGHPDPRLRQIQRMKLPQAIADAAADPNGLLHTPSGFKPRPALVALTGYAKTGKDTVADDLVEHHGFVRVAFADAVRELTGKLYGLPGDREWWQEHKADKWSSTITVRPGMAFPLGVLTSTSPGTGTLRDLLIHVGMNLRALDPDFWLRIALQAAERFRAAGQPVVITDCRFPNDAQAIVAAGGQIIRLHRRGCEPQGEADLAIDTIPPELIAGTVHNDGSIEALHLNIQISLRSRI